MSTNGKDNSGRIRIRCSAATESGSCHDAKTFYLKTVESAVLAGLENEMRHPQVIAEYVRTYHEERKRLSAKANAKRAHLELRLGELNREIDRLVDAIAKGHGDPAVLGPRSSALNEERKQVTLELSVEPAVDDTISLHPAVLARYQEQLVELQDALSKGINAGDSDATEAIRGLVETMTVFRDPSRPGGVTIEIAGRLSALLGEHAYPGPQLTQSSPSSLQWAPSSAPVQHVPSGMQQPGLQLVWVQLAPEQTPLEQSPPHVPLATVAREWTRIGLTGFGGPPAHISLLRDLMVGRRHWIEPRTFEDANAACSLLPGPASTQLAILCAYRVAGAAGAIVGGLGFIVPAVVMVIVGSTFVLAQAPPVWLRGAGAGAGAAVAAVAVRAAWDLVGPSRARVSDRPSVERRWVLYLLAAVAAAALLGPYLVLVLLACGVLELAIQRRSMPGTGGPAAVAPAIAATGGAGAVAWTAFKVGALSFGGGFVIIPLMQGDAVHVHHWMTNQQFLAAVALGQVTPGPVVATVAAVGYAALGVAGGVLAAAVAFAPSFCFVLAGGRRFEALRTAPGPRAFLDGAGPAAIGAIFGAAITLAAALGEAWQFALLAVAAVSLLALRRGVVETLVAAAVIGAVVALAGAPVP